MVFLLIVRTEERKSSCKTTAKTGSVLNTFMTQERWWEDSCFRRGYIWKNSPSVATQAASYKK